MNRRNFMKWVGRLLAALPFVALIDLEPEPELMQWWGADQGGNSYSTIQWMPDGEAIYSISLKDVLVFNEYSKEQLQDFWQQLQDMSGQEHYFNYVWKE